MFAVLDFLLIVEASHWIGMVFDFCVSDPNYLASRGIMTYAFVTVTRLVGSTFNVRAIKHPCSITKLQDASKLLS